MVSRVGMSIKTLTRSENSLHAMCEEEHLIGSLSSTSTEDVIKECWIIVRDVAKRMSVK